MEAKKILFLMSGSIACYKACDLISRLRQMGHEMQVVASSSVFKFVGSSTLEGLSGRKVYTDVWESGEAMAHIDLGKWCDFALLCPASAKTINGLAHGTAEDPIGSLFMAFDFSQKRFYLAPAMNSRMFEHFATQESLKKLIKNGVTVLPTEAGNLACGEVGQGRLLNPDLILQKILASEPRTGGPAKRILVTAGGTREHIDGVRYIGNVSTGKTGALITEYLVNAGHTVHHLCNQSSFRPKSYSSISFYQSYADLKHEMAAILNASSFDWVIHAAAVSDFSISQVINDKGEKLATGKIDSKGNVSISLAPNQKLIGMIKDWSQNKEIGVVGFKLTNEPDRSHDWDFVERVFKSNANVKYVIHNDLHEMSDNGDHVFRMFNEAKKATMAINAHQLARELEGIL